MRIPRKRFGQHFLCDQAVIQKIMTAFNPKTDEHIVEIGPGQGALTLPLLKRIHQLDVIELDRDLIPALKKRCARQGSLNIYEADALDFDFAILKKDDRLLRILGNLPYNISTPLIFHLLNYAPIISDFLFMLQKEVGERLAAQVNSEHYGRLSVMVQYHCEVNLLFEVGRRAFFPPPHVDSRLVQLIPHRLTPYVARDYAMFASLVKQAFGQRRKTLRNSLKTLVSDEMWSQLKIHSDLRPENLTVKDFVELSNALGQF